MEDNRSANQTPHTVVVSINKKKKKKKKKEEEEEEKKKYLILFPASHYEGTISALRNAMCLPAH
jgi:hypothetical protein